MGMEKKTAEIMAQSAVDELGTRFGSREQLLKRARAWPRLEAHYQALGLYERHLPIQL
jgi:hypothetical protein